MDEIDFESDNFADITSKDARYDARAYALLADVLKYLFSKGEHVDAAEIMEEFKERTLDQYGPMSFSVLREWGLTRCEDIGEMMSNLVESRRVGKEENDSPEAFVGAYDFETAFLEPYAV